jgi:hypothetical protein
LKNRDLKKIAAFPCAIFIVAVMIVAFSGAGRAELIDNGCGLVYDTDLNITWYIPDIEPMTWSEAVSWAAGLRVSDQNAHSVTGWRLPSVVSGNATGPCSDYNCTGSEFGYLYYRELKNVPGGPVTNKGPFSSLKGGVYWSALEWAPYRGNAWVFNFSTGRQGFADKNLYAGFYPMAVHDGNVGGSVQSVKAANYLDMGNAATQTPKASLRITQVSR